MSQPKSFDGQRKFERPLAFIFGARISDDDLTLAMEEERLSTVIIGHNVSVRTDETLYLKKVDEDFFLNE